MLNRVKQRYIRSKKLPNKWANFDAQTAATREAIANLPLNIWPNSAAQWTAETFDKLETRYLAGLESVWGPDHPAVQDARKLVTVTRSGPKKVFQFEDLF